MTRDYSQFLPSSAGGSLPGASLLQTLGWHPFFAQQIDADDMVRTPPVRVMEVHRSGLHIRGDGIDDTIPPRPDATVGDWLLLNRKDPKASRLLTRRSLIKRRAPGSDRAVQLIAANLDTAFIVTSCNQDFKIARLERYVALALDAEITPVIVLTKADLATDPAQFTDRARTISDAIPVIALDARGETARKALAPWCSSGKTVGFLGSSGVGKSTLTNALLGDGAIETQPVRADDDKGRHTTTRRQLHLLPGACLVLDTPGMRELQLTDAAAGIGEVFADLHDLASACRFNDCRHETEPGCAVLAAIEAGTLDPKRLARWHKLMAEDAFNSANLAERRSRDKAFGKMVREVKTLKDRGRG